MSKKDKERSKMTKTNDQTMSSGRVQKICQTFLTHSDSGLAHRLQKEEFDAHFDRNRSHRRDSRLGIKTARHVEEEEKQAFVAKQIDYYQRKKQLEENDIALAKKLQEQMKIKSNSIDQTTYNIHYQSSDDHNYYDETDRSSTYADTSSDEQLARILQEEEEEELSSSASTYRSHFNSTTV